MYYQTIPLDFHQGNTKYLVHIIDTFDIFNSRPFVTNCWAGHTLKLSFELKPVGFHEVIDQ